jgi:hypothetical protein
MQELAVARIDREREVQISQRRFRPALGSIDQRPLREHAGRLRPKLERAVEVAKREVRAAESALAHPAAEERAPLLARSYRSVVALAGVRVPAPAQQVVCGDDVALGVEEGEVLRRERAAGGCEEPIQRRHRAAVRRLQREQVSGADLQALRQSAECSRCDHVACVAISHLNGDLDLLRPCAAETVVQCDRGFEVFARALHVHRSGT